MSLLKLDNSNSKGGTKNTKNKNSATTTTTIIRNPQANKNKPKENASINNS